MLQEYQCHKKVHAKPMTRGDYNRISSNESGGDPLDDGYYVVYGLGTADEYRSWSPKKQFENGYSEI